MSLNLLRQVMLGSGAVPSPTHRNILATTAHLGVNSLSAALGGSRAVTATSAALGITTYPAVLRQPGTEQYPLIAAIRINSRAYAEDNSVGEAERAGIALCDVCVLGMFIGGGWDTGSSTYLSRNEVYVDLKARNPNLFIFEYTDVMETGEGGALAAILDAGTGPNGTDWWTYADTDLYPAGKVTTWSGSYNTNITTFTTADGEGKRYPQKYADYIQTNIIDKSTTLGFGPTGINIFNDVMATHLLTNNTDLDGSGTSDDARSYYDAANPTHAAHNGGLSVAAAGAWRAGQRAYLDQLTTDNTGLLVMGEIPLWSRQYSSTDEADAPDMLPEYVNLLHGGHLNNQSGDSFPASGVIPTGINNPVTAFGSWQIAQNIYTYALDNTLSPNLVMNDWHIYCAPTGLPNSPGGNVIRTSDPRTGTAFGLARWAICSTLMENGFINISQEPGSNFHGTPHFDEYGTVNAGTTGLYKGWLGTPIDDPQRSPWDGDIYKREFTNGLVLLHIDNDEGNSAHTVNVTGPGGIGAGIWRRIDGLQDPSWNDGSVVNANFTIPPIDGIILVRI